MADGIDLVIRGGQIVTPHGIVEGDLAVAGESIVSVGAPISTAEREIDVSGRLVLPGGVDVHAHIEQMSGMGQWNADTFETATCSAAMGGTTSVVSFAAQAAGQSLTDTVQDYADRAKRGAMMASGSGASEPVAYSTTYGNRTAAPPASSNDVPGCRVGTIGWSATKPLCSSRQRPSTVTITASSACCALRGSCGCQFTKSIGSPLTHAQPFRFGSGRVADS